MHEGQDGSNHTEQPDSDLDRLIRDYGSRHHQENGRDDGGGGPDIAGWLHQHSLLFDNDGLADDMGPPNAGLDGAGLLAFQNDYSLVDEILPWTQHLSDLSRVASPFSLRGANVPLQSMLTSAGVIEAQEIMAPAALEEAASPGRIVNAGISEDMKRLIHHYQTHVCTLMMPTADPSNNPWLRLYLPMALEEPGSLPRKALLQAILAVAAFNKANLSKDDEQVYRRQASEYNEKAAELLRSAVQGFRQYPQNIDGKERQALLAAALTMTTIEVSEFQMMILGNIQVSNRQ